MTDRSSHPSSHDDTANLNFFAYPAGKRDPRDVAEAERAARKLLRPVAILSFSEVIRLYRLFEAMEVILPGNPVPEASDIPSQNIAACIEYMSVMDSCDRTAFEEYLRGDNGFLRACLLIEARARQILQVSHAGWCW